MIDWSKLTGRFRLGVQYHRPPTPPADEWAADLAHIARLGLDHIYIWVMWADVEREPGVYQWTSIDRLVDLAGQHGLDVILNLEPWAVPTWCERDELRLIRPDGTPRPFSASLIHSLYSGRPCLDNQQARALLAPFIRATVQHYRSLPNLLCWKVWNEPDVDACACPDTLTKYRGWLRRRFGTLDEASRFFGRQYNSCADLRPPADTVDTPSNLLHTQFRFWSAVEVLEWTHSLVRAEDPGHPILADTMSRSTARLDLAGDRIFDDWALAPVPDIYGGHLHSTIFEPAHDSPLGFVNPVIDLEAKRSATRDKPTGFWTTELPGGMGRAGGLHRTLWPGEMRHNLWTAIAHGARSISPWQFKPERIGPEAFGWGLVELDGAPTYRTAELDEWVKVLREHERLFVEARPPAADCAVLYSPESSVAVASLGMGALRYTDAFHGAVAALWLESVQFDIVRSGTDLSPYRVVYAPMPWLLPTAELSRLAAFVRSGGTLCVEAGFASLDDNGWAAPRAPRSGLWEAFGYREGEARELTTARIRVAGGSLAGAGQRRAVHMAGAEVIGAYEDGEPAALQMAVGAGRVVYFSTYPSLHFHSQVDRAAAQTLLQLLGLQPIASVAGEGTVTCSLLTRAEERLLLVFNHLRQPAQATVEPAGGPGAWSVLYADGGSAATGLDTGRLDISLSAKGVAVLRLAPQH